MKASRHAPGLRDDKSESPWDLAEADFSAAVEAVTSAFGDRTRREIYLFVRESTGSTAAQVASRFELHPNVARHHLDKLAAGGYVEVSLAPLGAGGAGRPSKVYRATERSHSLEFPARRDDLLVTLLARTLARLEPEVAEKVAEEVGVEYGRSLAAQMAPEERERSVKASLSAVAEALTAHGFAAHAQARGASIAVISEHCPFGDTAQAHPVICAVDRGIVKGMLQGLSGRPVKIRNYSRARGDDDCAAVV